MASHFENIAAVFQELTDEDVWAEHIPRVRTSPLTPWAQKLAHPGKFTIGEASSDGDLKLLLQDIPIRAITIHDGGKIVIRWIADNVAVSQNELIDHLDLKLFLPKAEVARRGWLRLEGSGELKIDAGENHDSVTLW